VVAAEDSVVVAVAAGGADKRPEPCVQEQTMKSSSVNRDLYRLAWLLGLVICGPCSSVKSAAQQTVTKEISSAGASVSDVRTFDTPQQAATLLIKAAEDFNVSTLMQIFGHDAEDVIFSGEFAQDRKHAADFVAEAHEKNSISVDPKTGTRAFLLVGNEDWPFPVPIVRRGTRWAFDTRAGREELLYRRIGANELDAIAICHGYVEAQHEYALQPHVGYDVNQYAQQIISTPGKQDGLAWQNADGTWDGPIGEKIARAIEQGYTSRAEPYHGYFFKVLKGQGPGAPLGRMDFVVNGVMIGGFALLAAPAEYGVTGLKSFIVSHDGVVFEKDLGSETLDEFQRMELFSPDKSWTPVPEQS
jgi:DUF2950 family protein